MRVDAFSDLRREIEAAGLDPELEPADRRAKLTDLRGRTVDLVGLADRLLAGVDRVREADANAATREVLRARQNADLRETLEGEGWDGDELERAGLFSHAELDRLAEEGLLEEALGRHGLRSGGSVVGFVSSEHPRQAKGRVGGGEFAAKSGGGMATPPHPAARRPAPAGRREARVHEQLSPYFELDHPGTHVVPIEQTRRLRDDPEEKVARARDLMDRSARGDHPKRKPLSARREEDGSFTIMDGKSTHTVAEQKGLTHVPVRVVEDAAQTRQERVEIADRLAAAAEAAEPKVTPVLSETAAQVGGTLEGLEFRLKTRDSIAGKIERKQRKYPGASAEDAAASITDTLRYTAVFPPERYVEGVKKVLDGLRSAGFDPYQQENYWGGGDDYDAYHANLKGPGGVEVELQFHTPESLHTKSALNHPVYEAFRVSTDPHERYRLWGQMVSNMSRLSQPAGVRSLGNFTTHPAPAAP